MPSGPKKRQAARRKKKREEEQHQRPHSDGDSVQSDSVDDEDQLASPGTASSAADVDGAHIPPAAAAAAVLDLGEQQKRSLSTEEWVRESSFEVGTPPPQTPPPKHHHHQQEEEQCVEDDNFKKPPYSSSSSDEPLPAADDAKEQVHYVKAPTSGEQPRESAAGCCGVIQWLLGMGR